MRKILLFGGTGHLGKQIAAELQRREFETTAVVRNTARGAVLDGLVARSVVADVTRPEQLEGLFADAEIVISSLGKSVSPNDRGKPSFAEIDLDANSNILAAAVRANIKKFVYVSAVGAERYPELEYFRVHHEFSERLISSGLDYAIIKPPALFSAFLDLIDLAKKGRLINIGRGDKKTNPIYEGDLATVCVDAIDQPKAIIEAGGPEILTRGRINEIIQNHVAPSKKVRAVTPWAFKLGLPFVKVFDRNAFDKFAFFFAVTQHDTLAPQIGKLRLVEYVERAISSGVNN